MNAISCRLKKHFLITLSIAATSLAFAGPEPVTALNGFDPVALIQGAETKGQEALQVTPGRYRYPSKAGEICRTFSDFKVMEGGLIMPQNSDVTYDGKSPTGPKPASNSVALNVPIEPRLFPKMN